jgi:hypothetical protein
MKEEFVMKLTELSQTIKEHPNATVLDSIQKTRELKKTVLKNGKRLLIEKLHANANLYSNNRIERKGSQLRKEESNHVVSKHTRDLHQELKEGMTAEMKEVQTRENGVPADPQKENDKNKIS